MGHPVWEQGVGASHYIVACRHGTGGQTGQHGVGQAIGVAELIDPAALGLHRAVLPQHPLPGNASQEALHRPAGLVSRPLDLPGQDPSGPLGHLGLQGGGNQQRPHILIQLRGGGEAAVGPAVAGLVALHASFQLPPHGLEGGPVIAFSQVHIALHQAGVLWLHHMGRSTIHHRRPQGGDHDRIQGIRIAGAADVLHSIAPLLQGGSHLLHQGGFAAARPALEDTHIPGSLRIDKLVVQGVKAPRGVGA